MFLSKEKPERWAFFIHYHEDDSPEMAALVRHFSVTEAASTVSILTCLDTLSLTRADVWNESKSPQVRVEYWPHIKKFRIYFNAFMDIKFDQKYCTMDETIATLVFACNRLMYASDGLLERQDGKSNEQ